MKALIIKMMKTPFLMKFLMNLYPPFIGAGIRTVYVSPDFQTIRVRMKMRWYNRNYVGVHFGGSLYAMTDPFFMLILMQKLGWEYIVWDKGASIDFVKPGLTAVTAEFNIDSATIKDIKKKAQKDKYLPEFSVNVLDEHGNVIAMVNKILYVKKKQSY